MEKSWAKVGFASQNSSNATSLGTFTKFPQLPLELRRMVWNIAASQPRILELYASYDDCVCWYTRGRLVTLVGDREEQVRMAWSRNSLRMMALPAVLQTNQESRSEASRVFEAASASFYRPSPEHADAAFRADCYLNYSHDTIYFGIGIRDIIIDQLCSDVCPETPCGTCHRIESEDRKRTEDSGKSKSSGDITRHEMTAASGEAEKHHCPREMLHHKIKHVAIDDELFNWQEKASDQSSIQSALCLLASMPNLETATIIFRSEDDYDNGSDAGAFEEESDYQDQQNVFCGGMGGTNPVVVIRRREAASIIEAEECWERLRGGDFGLLGWVDRTGDDDASLVRHLSEPRWRNFPVLKFAVLERQNAA